LQCTIPTLVCSPDGKLTPLYIPYLSYRVIPPATPPPYNETVSPAKTSGGTDILTRPCFCLFFKHLIIVTTSDHHFISRHLQLPSIPPFGKFRRVSSFFATCTSFRDDNEIIPASHAYRLPSATNKSSNLIRPY